MMRDVGVGRSLWLVGLLVFLQGMASTQVTVQLGKEWHAEPRLGHRDAVHGIAFSPDGQLLASGSWDGMVKVWSVAGGGCLRTLRGHQGPVEGVAFSPDGRWVASAGGSRDMTVRVWDVASGSVASALSGHMGAVLCVAFSPDGQWLASGSRDDTIRLWSLQTGRCQVTLRQEPPAASSEEQQGGRRKQGGDVNAVAFSPNGRLLASVSEDGWIRLWEVPSGQLQHQWEGHARAGLAVAFSPDGQLLASSGQDALVKLYSPRP